VAAVPDSSAPASGRVPGLAAILLTPPSVVAAIPAAPAPAATCSMERRDGARLAPVSALPVSRPSVAAVVPAAAVSSGSGMAIPFDVHVPALSRARGQATRHSRLVDLPHAGRSCHAG